MARMASRRPTKSLTVKIDANLVDRLRTWVRNQRGAPLFASVNGTVETAIARELERQILIRSGALPIDRMTERDDDDQPPPPALPRRHINAHT